MKKYKMKNRIFIALAALFTISSNCCLAQSINWAALKAEEKHLVNLQVGVDYGLIYGVGYSYQLSSRLPALLSAEYSFPSGNKITDDFKIKIGGQVQLFEANNIRMSVNLYGIFRRYENALVQLSNFGSSANAVVGYYSSKWFFAGEIGLDKAIVTHFKHKDGYKENFPDVQDGWYEPTTGGNFQYGLQVGYSFKRGDVYLKGGRTVTQDFKTKPTVPLYLQIGYNLKLK